MCIWEEKKCLLISLKWKKKKKAQNFPSPQCVCDIIGGVLVTKDSVSIRVFHFKATIPTGARNSTPRALEKRVILLLSSPVSTSTLLLAREPAGRTHMLCDIFRGTHNRSTLN